MKSFFVLALMMFSARSYACVPGCTPASPEVKQCLVVTVKTFDYKDPALTSPDSVAGRNCLMAAQLGVVNFYTECISKGSPRTPSSFIANCKDQAKSMVRATPAPGVPRPPVTSRNQCEFELRKALAQFPDSTVQRYMSVYRNTNECDLLLSCIDKTYATGRFSLDTVNNCKEKAPGRSDGPTHPTSIQSSGEAPMQ